MSVVYKSCEDAAEIPDYKANPCGEYEHGRIRSLVLINEGTEITIPITEETMESEWLQGIEARAIRMIQEATGTFDGGTPKMIPGFGDKKEVKSGDDYVVVVKDPNFTDNADFWAKAEKKKWNIAFRTETQLFYVGDSVTLTAKSPIEEDTESVVQWNIELKWFSKNKPVITPFKAIKKFFTAFELSK